MTSYDNEYNRSLRRKVMGLDVANIGNDRINAAQQPLEGGAGRKQRRREASVLDDVDFAQRGMRGGDFLDDLLSGLNKGAQIANTSLDLYNKVGQTFGKKGMGMSGGVRRGAELSDVMAPQGVTGQMLARKRSSNKGSALLAGSGRKLTGGERMTGDNYTPNWREIEAEQAKDGFIGAGDMQGGDFFSDLLSGINSVAGVISPIAQIAGKFGAGESGSGKKPRKIGKRLAMKIAELQGRGAGTYGMPALLGMEGSGPISDLGIPGLSQIAGLFGLGMSGGAADGADDPAFDTPAPQAYSKALATAFLGGRKPSSVSKAEKKMLFMKALADAKMHQELGKMMRGKGMSGGAAPLMCGLGLSGGDFFGDLIGTIGNVAQTAAHVAPLFGLGDMDDDEDMDGGAYQPMQGSGLTDMPGLNATPVRYSYNKMGNIAGMANGSGMPAKKTARKMKGGYLQPPPTQVGVSMSGMGYDSDSDAEDAEMEGGDFFGDLLGTIGKVGQTALQVAPLFGLGEQDREVGAGQAGSGRSSAWINHVKAYQRKHGCSYKDALKRAAASYRR